MNFSEEVKSELLAVKYKSDCCYRSALSAFLRMTGSIISRGGNYGLEISTDNEYIAHYFANIIDEIYGEECRFSNGADKLNKKDRTTFSCVSKNSLAILVDSGIVKLSDGGIDINIDLDWSIVEKDCCKVAYMRGAFLGGGSVTLPKTDGSSSTGYHLEFVFSNYRLATDFCELLSEAYFMPKLIERKGSYVVYFKNRDEITDILAMIGANNAVIKLSELAVEKDMNNEFNRKLNCEMNNMTKQIGASVKQIRAVEKLDKIIGLDKLPESLRVVAKARCENKDKTLFELADLLGITKSCLNHRLRKIVAMADEI